MTLPVDRLSIPAFSTLDLHLALALKLALPCPGGGPRSPLYSSLYHRQTDSLPCPPPSRHPDRTLAFVTIVKGRICERSAAWTGGSSIESTQQRGEQPWTGHCRSSSNPGSSQYTGTPPSSYYPMSSPSSAPMPPPRSAARAASPLGEVSLSSPGTSSPVGAGQQLDHPQSTDSFTSHHQPSSLACAASGRVSRSSSRPPPSLQRQL